MRLFYLVGWAFVTSLIFACVGLAFLPHTAACLLAPAQKFLSNRSRPRQEAGE